MPITKTFNNTSYSIPLEGELNWATLSSFLVALADYSQTINKQKVGMRVAIATPVTVLATTDCVIVTDLTVAGAVAVNLPAGVSGQVFTVVDGKGDAGTNNITITPAAGTINGAATYVIDSNRAGVSLAYNGTSWTVIAEFISAGDIPRNQIAAGTANHVVINDGAGDLSSEAALAASRGGLATNASAFSGYVKSAAGVFSASAIAAGDLPTLIDATKIADGSVTNTEFQYINTLSSNAQTQIGDRVVGAASSTDNALARFDLATGKVIQNSGIIVDDSNNVTGVNDMTVTGDLTVNGATVTVNTATLDVEDTNITVNKGGNDASSAGAGLTVDRTGTKGSIVYDTTATSKFKVGNLASEVEIATISGAQVLTAKDIDGGTASNTSRITIPKDTKTNLDALTRKEGTLVYASDLDKLYADDGAALKEIGSGGSGINYLADYFTAETIGTVGTANVTDTGARSTGTFAAWQSTNTANISLAVSATNPLRYSKCFLFSGSGNNASGTTFVESPAFQIHVADLGKPVMVSFDIADVTADGNFDVVMVRYNSSGAYQEKISIAGNASGATPASAKLPTGISKFNGFFISSSTDTDYYALRFRRLAGTDVPRLDSNKISPDTVIQGAAVTDWVSYTPTGSWSTNTTYTGKWRRVGDSMEVQIELALAGTPTTADLYIEIPAGYLIDTTKVNPTSGLDYPIYGAGGIFDSGTRRYVTNVVHGGSSIVGFSHTESGNSGLVNATNPISFGSGDKITGIFTIPIVGWSSSVTMANRSVEEYSYNSGGTWDADDSTTFGYGLAGGTMSGGLTAGGRTKRVRFTTPAQANDHIELLVTDGTTYLPALQFADTSNNRIVNGKMADGTDVGFLVKRVSGSTTDFDVFFHQYAASANDDSPAQNWINGWKWLLKKTSGGASVGFPVSARNIVGDVSGTTVPSGYIGETISISRLYSAKTAIPATTVAGNVIGSTLTLSAGKWLISGAVGMDVGGVPTITDAVASVSTTSATLSGFSTMLTPDSSGQFQVSESPTCGTSGHTINITPYELNLNATSSPLYLVAKYNYTGGSSLTFFGYLKAVRIA